LEASIYIAPLYRVLVKKGYRLKSFILRNMACLLGRVFSGYTARILNQLSAT